MNRRRNSRRKPNRLATGDQESTPLPTSSDSGTVSPSPSPAATPPEVPPPTPGTLRGYWGLGMFGLAIGFMGALSQANGTTVTLFGLLFALIGGSLAPYFSKTAAKTAFDPAKRYEFFNALGLFSVGLIAGLFCGFSYQTLDSIWLDPIRMAALKQPPGVASAKAETNDSPTSDTGIGPKKPEATSPDKTKAEVRTSENPTKPPLGPPKLHSANIEQIKRILGSTDLLIKHIQENPDDPDSKSAREPLEALKISLDSDLEIGEVLTTIQNLIEKDNATSGFFDKAGFRTAFEAYLECLR